MLKHELRHPDPWSEFHRLDKTPATCADSAVQPALETLMLAFSGEDGLQVPARALFIGAQAHPALREWPELLGWQPLKPMADAWDRAGFPRTDDLPDGQWPLVLVLPGKSRDGTLAWFALARDRVQPGGRIIAAMPNTAGAARFEKELSKAVGNITSIQKHKCRAFHAVEDGTWNESLFGEWRGLAKPKLIPETNFITQAGIFSSDHIDPGSQLLADHLPANLHGRVADLGAGWGFLSDAALRRCPRIGRIDLFEADYRALDCAKRNLACHLTSDPISGVHKVVSGELTADYTDYTDARIHEEGSKTVTQTSSQSVSICEICGSNSVIPLGSPVICNCDESRIRFHWHDVTTGLPETYDFILMNPPFHSGQETDVDLGRAFISVAAASLKRNGKLYLVANRQLPYEPMLDSLRLAWRKVAEDKTYKLLFAEKR
jgi:16S rRNA (guanine1207-N2)-methyltransferase